MVPQRRTHERGGAACLLSASLLVAGTGNASAQDAGDLGMQLANPVASLISVPIQFNYDRGFGPDDDSRITANIQPVIPIGISDRWNLISRTILPVTIPSDLPQDIGFGDIVQSAFFSPKEPGPGGLIWGVGPVALRPFATAPELGGGKFGAGPTGVALVQRGPWTVGGLANHIWSFGGDPSRPDINATFLQPFVTYTTPGGFSLALQTETTYDWARQDWNVPVNLIASQVTSVGGQLISLSGGVGYYVDSFEGAPDGFRARIAVTFLFPK